MSIGVGENATSNVRPERCSTVGHPRHPDGDAAIDELGASEFLPRFGMRPILPGTDEQTYRPRAGLTVMQADDGPDEMVNPLTHTGSGSKGGSIVDQNAHVGRNGIAKRLPPSRADLATATY
jgi:hypothetical protein